MFIQGPEHARMGEDLLPFEMGYLPPFYKRKAEIELHDSPEHRIQGLRQIREMAKNDKNFVGLDFDDDFLLQYIIARKYNIARAFSQLKSFVNLRKKNPNMFTNFKFHKTVTTLTKKFVSFLPYRCQDGCAILLVQLDNWEPEKFPLEEVKRMVVIFLLQSLRDLMTVVNGVKVIFDVKSNPIKHLRHCTPHNLYLLYHGTQECVPGRYKGVHIVNQSLTSKAAWMVIKPFLTDKLKKRIHFHSEPEALLDYFPRAILPTQYGGDLKDYDMTGWLRDVMRPEKLATLGGGLSLPQTQAKESKKHSDHAQEHSSVS